MEFRRIARISEVKLNRPASIFSLRRVQERPCDDPALFLSLRQVNDSNLPRVHPLEVALNRWEIFGLRNEGRKPDAAIGELCAFSHHSSYKGHPAALAPKLVLL